MICVKAAFFPQMGTGSVVRACSRCVCIFGSTSLRAVPVCLKHDVQLLTSSDHMKHPCLSDLVAVLLLSSRFFLPLLPSEGAVAWGRARSPTLNHWTSKGRHKLAHIWGQNRSHLSSHCEDEEGGVVNEQLLHN